MPSVEGNEKEEEFEADLVFEDDGSERNLGAFKSIKKKGKKSAKKVKNTANKAVKTVKKVSFKSVDEITSLSDG